MSAWMTSQPAVEPTLCLLEIAHPHRNAGKCPEGGREHRALAQAIMLSQGYRLMTTFACVS